MIIILEDNHTHKIDSNDVLEIIENDTTWRLNEVHLKKPYNCTCTYSLHDETNINNIIFSKLTYKQLHDLQFKGKINNLLSEEEN